MVKPSGIVSVLFLVLFAATTIACSHGKSTSATAKAAKATTHAAMSPQDALRALVGRWECVTRLGHRTWRETDNDSRYGRWLRESVAYPAQNGEPAFTGVNYLGYDAVHHRWIFASVDTAGGYSVSYSKSPHYNGSRWAGAYPKTAGSSLVTMPNGNSYTVEEKGGTMAGSRTVCARS